jgi:ribosomal protein L33
MSDLIQMTSTGKTKKNRPTGSKYVRSKNKKTKTEKLEQMRFDRLAYNEKTGKCGMHVKYVETKLSG